MACHEIHHAHRIDRNLLHIPWKLGPNQPGGSGESSDWHCWGRPNLSRGRRTLRHDGVDVETIAMSSIRPWALLAAATPTAPGPLRSTPTASTPTSPKPPRFNTPSLSLRIFPA